MPSVQHFAVVGHPISHSKSPTLHQAAYSTLGLEWTYSAVDVAPGGLTSFIRNSESVYSGLSVTMPHKTEALEVSRTIDLLAEQSQSVNTLLFGVDGQVSGFNTDVWGIVEALADSGLRQVRHASVIGAGATASSAVVAAAELGAEHVSVIARTVTKAFYLKQVGQRCGVNVSVHSFTEMDQLTDVDLCISTLPGTADTSLNPLPRKDRATLLDVAYSPWPSMRAAEWSLAGGEVVSGLRMLAHQALKQVRIFVTGSPFEVLPKEAEVKQAMFAAVSLPTY